MPRTSHRTIAWSRGLRADRLAPRERALRAVVLVAAVLVGLEALHDIGVIPGPPALFEVWVHDLVVVTAAALCFAYAADAGHDRQASLAFGTGLLAWAAGDLWWTAFYEDDPDPPFPTLAD